VVVGHGDGDGAVAADDLDRVFDGGPFVGVEVVEPGFDAGDQPPDPVDLFVGWCGLLSCPVVELGAGEEAFAVAEQVVEVGVEVGEVGDVGAEVVTACAAESERAGPAPGSDVRRFGADAVGDGDLAQGPPGVFGVDKGLRFLPDRFPCRSTARAATRSTASRRRGSPTR